MENLKSYRNINKEEKDEIDRLATKALSLLSIDVYEKSEIILKKMDEFVETILDSKDFKDSIEDYSYELGSLFGNIICKEHNWEWYWLDINDEIFYCVASSKQKACCICHNYFYSILSKQQSNNFRLLFNLIEKTYPKDWKFVTMS